MANLLSSFLEEQGNLLTPVFPVETNYKSSLVGDALSASPRLVVKNTDKAIFKSGDTLSINGQKYDISYKNVLDVVNLLNKEGVYIKFLDNTVGWDLPAACILDFSNSETLETKLTHTPFSLESLNILKNQGISPQGDTIVRPILAFDKRGNQKGFETNGSYITSVHDFSKGTLLLYNVLSPTFLIKISDNKFSTTRTDILSKYMDTTQ